MTPLAHRAHELRGGEALRDALGLISVRRDQDAPHAGSFTGIRTHYGRTRRSAIRRKVSRYGARIRSSLNSRRMNATHRALIAIHRSRFVVSSWTDRRISSMFPTATPRPSREINPSGSKNATTGVPRDQA